MGSTPAAPGSNVTGEAIGGNATFDSNYLQEKTNSEDAIWILSCTFVIFTMQSGRFNNTPCSTDVNIILEQKQRLLHAYTHARSGANTPIPQKNKASMLTNQSFLASFSLKNLAQIVDRKDKLA